MKTGDIIKMSALYRKNVSDAGRVTYVPVADWEAMDSFPVGHTLVSVSHGCTRREFQIDPAMADVRAAFVGCREAMLDAMRTASALKPSRKPITERQRAAWQALADAFGEQLFQLDGPSAADVVEAGLRACEQRWSESRA